jgi:hypothetical protein
LVGGSFWMEVGRGLLYPHQTMLDDIQIDTSSYAVVKVDMVHDNLKDLKLEVLNKINKDEIIILEMFEVVFAKL